MGVERRGRVILWIAGRSTRRLWEESDERATRRSPSRKPFDIPKAGGMGSVSEGQGEQGRTGGGRVLVGGVRGGSAGEPVQDLEPDAGGELLPAAGTGCGDTQVQRVVCGCWESPR